MKLDKLWLVRVESLPRHTEAIRVYHHTRVYFCMCYAIVLGFIMTFRSCEVTLVPLFMFFFTNFFNSISFQHSQRRVDISCTNGAGDSGAFFKDFTRGRCAHGGTTDTAVRVATTVHLS